VAAEGWRWVVAEPEFDHEASAAMRRVFAKPVPRSKPERKRLRKLLTRMDPLYERHEERDVADEIARNEAAIEALRKEEYEARDIALAGAFVTLSGDGSVRSREDRGSIARGDRAGSP
jgi:ParB family transcriptional regulator, chromosome partitioning protein